MIMEHIR